MTGKSRAYRVMMNELQEVIERLQSEDTDIDEALLLYERGQKLVVELTEYLEKAANKIQLTSLDTNLASN